MVFHIYTSLVLTKYLEIGALCILKHNIIV